ncbi:MAG: hypothetical protein A2033_08990 [Bacteroidetes bacterium GWA2_31_9]|nr:MAG: hypothetical protein A2033_08990 [Bacteroidetes bacterium GWA2_31_9]
MILRIALITLTLLTLNTKLICVKPQSDDKKVILPPFYTNSDTLWVDSVMKSLTPDERIGQLFMIAAYSNKDKQHEDYIEKIIKENAIGGLIFMQGGPSREANLTNKYQAVSKVPLMISIDGEWGLSMRLDSTPKYPRQIMLGAIQNDELIYEMGKQIAMECKRVGININFAPVIDINNNPKNPVINSRSFGENKYNVASKGTAYMKGMQDQNVLATGKHFPGHGDTNSDSHLALPLISQSYNRLDSLELYPFKQLINSGLGSIMTAHLKIPALDTTPNLAASISPKIVHGLLKDTLQFKGLIFTDALNMKGVSDYFPPGVVDVKALLAGNDILLFSGNVPKAIEEIKNAITNGEISQKEIDDRCRKILLFKSWTGLKNKQIINTENLYYDLNSVQSDIINHKLVKSAITLVTNRDSIIPIQNLDTLKIATVAVNESKQNTFQNYLNLYLEVSNFQIPKNNPTAKTNALIDSLKIFDLVIVGIHNSNNSPAKNFGISKDNLDFINQLSEKTKVIVDFFANPYILDSFSGINNASAVIMSYEDSELAQMYSAQLIFGGIPALGKLPVSAGGFGEGTGIILEKQLRLEYTIPELADIDRIKLEKIDSIAINGIREGAYPGCQILVAKDGKVIFNKSFGYQTFESKKYPITNDNIYDLASITKMVSTTASLMKLYEEDKFDFNKKLGEYLTYLDSSDKADILIKDVLTHQAQLSPWIPFWMKTVKDKALKTDLYSTKESSVFPLLVYPNIYIKKEYTDSMYFRIRDSKLLEKKEYKYSDLGFYLFQRIVEQQSGEKLDVFASKNFYSPLGASTLGYNPADRFPVLRMPPTQFDADYRKQLIQGYVHDPGAAMIGGVAGHAGTFSNANDLAKLMQMLLQKGSYGGKKYFNPETIELFTKCQYCDIDNRRGLGFDKPEQTGLKPSPVCRLASPNSFGHTGFTGTIAWADPDENLVYIFLSNRICPDQENKKLIKMNIREKIQEVIYNSIKSK